MSPRTAARHGARPHLTTADVVGADPHTRRRRARRTVAIAASASLVLGLYGGVASASVDDDVAGPLAVLDVPDPASAGARATASLRPLIAEAMQERAQAEAVAAQAAADALAAQAAAEAEAAAAAQAAAAQAASQQAASSGSRVLDVAARGSGVPYRYGGTTQRGWDCSGYTGWVYRQLGVSLPRTSGAQRSVAHKVPRAQARPGDLVFWPGHVGIYAGGGMVWHAPYPGKRTGKDPIWGSPTFGRVL